MIIAMSFLQIAVPLALRQMEMTQTAQMVLMMAVSVHSHVRLVMA